MSMQRAGLLLTAINLTILVWLLAGPQLVSASGDAGILRGSALEIVDSEGRIRASLGIISSGGDTSTETVLLRLINAEGQPSVKIGVSANASSMNLVGGDDDSYILISADGPANSLRLVGPDGAARTIAP